MNRPFYLLLFILFVLAESKAQNPVLEAYISEGLRSNLHLKQQQLDYSRDLMALRESRGMFFPDISLNARYTVAEGGRIIDFPVGDMLNPVYSTLNLLTMSEMFPQIENESFPFYRPREHETKVSLIQPIFSTDLIYNTKIKKEAAEISRIDVDQYKRELVLEITKAFYNYQKAYYLLRLMDTTLVLVDENVRVNQRLFENDKVTMDVVYRSEAERSAVESEQARAQNLVESSRAYFNFLLNRELGEEVILVSEDIEYFDLTLTVAQETAVQRREELDLIKRYQEMNRQYLNLNRGKNVPALYGVVDYGFQGEEYRFTADDDFLLASLVMRWDLFQGMTNRSKIKQITLDQKKLEEAYLELEQQIRLEVINRYYALLAAQKSLQAAKKQKTSATGAYRLINRKYYEGQSSLLELIDARTSMTRAASEVIIATNEYFILKAELEHALGNVDLYRY